MPDDDTSIFVDYTLFFFFKKKGALISKTFARLTLFMSFSIAHFPEFCAKNTLIFTTNVFYCVILSLVPMTTPPPTHPKVKPSLQELFHRLNCSKTDWTQINRLTESNLWNLNLIYLHQTKALYLFVHIVPLLKLNGGLCRGFNAIWTKSSGGFRNFLKQLEQ